MPNKMQLKKYALTLSLCLLILWSTLGTGTSLAWFTDISPELNNIFHFGEFDLEVYHQLTDGNWELVDSQTRIFDENALYEPGYVQVVYLKVVNTGDIEFQFDTTVTVTGYTEATNAFGDKFKLQEHLRFGMITAATAQQMKDSIPDREAAAQIAVLELDWGISEPVILQAEKEAYVALVVQMPEAVGNVANYRGSPQPMVELGVIVNAQQVIDE